MWFSAMCSIRLIAASGVSATCATGIFRLTIDVILCTSECSRRFGDIAFALYLPLSTALCFSSNGIRALCERFRIDTRLSFSTLPLTGCCCWWWWWCWWLLLLWWWWFCFWCWWCWLFERSPGEPPFNNSSLAFITSLFSLTACCGCCTILCSMMTAFFGWRMLENGRELNNCSVEFGLRGNIGGDRSIPFGLMNVLRDVDPAKLFRRLAVLNLFSDSVNWCKFCVDEMTKSKWWMWKSWSGSVLRNHNWKCGGGGGECLPSNDATFLAVEAAMVHLDWS